MGIDWILAWLLIGATAGAVKNAVVDGWVQIIDPRREAPSLVNRRARAELAQQQAAARVELAQRQAAAGVPPAPGQAAADKLASWIASPPSWPSWIVDALSYIALLLADKFASARRQHVQRQKEREARERGERPHRDTTGPFCGHCEINPVDKPDDLCDTCAPVVLAACPVCGVHVPVDELRTGSCTTCQVRADATAPSTGQSGPARLVLPSWLTSPQHSEPESGPGQQHQHHNGGTQ